MRLTWPEALTQDDHAAAITELREYFGLEPFELKDAYTGASFERLGGGGDRGEVRNVITPEDLVAVTMLSVDVPALAALRILGPDGRQISDLLSELPTALDLVDVEPEVINETWAGWRLWTLLKSMDDIGYVTAGKLCARKRPRLLPVYDSVVEEQVGARKDFWRDLNDDLRLKDKALHTNLLEIRDEAGIGDDISALRVFDIVTWMIGSKARRARNVAT